ncbi:MAG: hypothetical protein MUF19_00535 [Candidatus Pacebacteria bacterium]|jgi:hypothetical protein|nr:hypothetical protein [Candidatus Paceibacterota bacterium]
MNRITYAGKAAILYSLSIVLIGAFLYSLIEPTISRAAASATDTFLITQQITDEISFLTTAADVTMVGSIQGVTGGHATGTTFAVVRSNSNSGYTMDITFSGAPAMRGTSTLSTAIRDFASSSSMVQPSFAFTASTAAQFGYTVAASTTSDLDPSFLNNGTTCNAGVSYTANTCWMSPSTTAFRIVNRSTSAPTGATTTLTFRVTVPSNPSPALDEDFYVATATLTATNQ